MAASAMGSERKPWFSPAQASSLTSLKSWSNNILPRCWVSRSFVRQLLGWMCERHHFYIFLSVNVVVCVRLLTSRFLLRL